MKVSDWILIGTTSILAIVAFAAPYVIEKWKHKFYSAKLKFIFLHQPPYCHITQMMGTGTSFPVYYFRFIIKNEGKTQAEQCEVLLQKIYKENSAGELKEMGGFTPVRLKWSGVGKDRYLTIQPEREVFCDIGRIQSASHEPESVFIGITNEDREKNKFFFEMPERFYAQWDCLVPGKYKIELAVYCKNAPKATKEFYITWSGQWKDREVDMLNELVISSLDKM
jgi:hypothetical protein